MATEVLTSIPLTSLPRISQGKVRYEDVYTRVRINVTGKRAVLVTTASAARYTLLNMPPSSTPATRLMQGAAAPDLSILQGPLRAA